MPSILLQVDSLSLATGEGYITKDISFEINKGEIIALTGKSGSGKTSVAMAILGLLPPGIKHLAGQISLSLPDRTLSLPKDATLWPALRGTHIGFTQQDVYGAFDPVIRMGKQMMMVVAERTQHPQAEIEKEIRIKMEEVGLTDIERLWNSYPHELSGGQLQRCQICMAIVIQPELLITDEPTSAIDKINQTELLDVFSNLREKYNMAILCITHETSVVQYLADREIRIGEIDSAPIAVSGIRASEVREDMKPLLSAEMLCYAYRFGGIRSKKGALVGPLDFSIQAGTCLGIIGESGSGKSTLAQLLVGLLEPSSGHLLLEGQEIDFKKPKDIRWLRSRVQLVMQDGRGSLHPYFTIGRLLKEVVARHGKDEAEADIRNILQDVNLTEQILDRYPGTLSGGECLRVSIARALLLQPKVLICDESTSALDTATRNGIMELLKTLRDKKSLAMIFISHDEYLIREMADQIMVLSDGRVVEQGLSTEVIQFPAQPLTKKIFGGPATLSERKPL
jgi:peptide/nickel transport system ATP-binding protein